MGQNSEQLHVHWQLPVGVGKDIEQMAQIRAERVGAASSSVVRREYRLGMSAPLTYTCVRENTYIPSPFGLWCWGDKLGKS